MAFKHAVTPIDPSSADPGISRQRSNDEQAAREKREHPVPRPINSETGPSNLDGKQGRGSSPSADDGGKPSSKTDQRKKTGRIINWRFLLISVVVVQAIAVSAYVWRELRVKNQANYYLRLAADAENEGAWADAASALRDYLWLSPDDVEARIRLAKMLDRSADNAKSKFKAVSHYYHALGLAPDQIDLIERLSVLLVELGGYPPAEQQAERLLELDPKNSIGWRVRAVCLYQSWRRGGRVEADVSSVIDVLNRALELNQGDVELSSKLAEIYREELEVSSETVRQELADTIMDRMVNVDANRADARLARYHYRRKYNLPDMDLDLTRALDLAPQNVHVRVACGARAEEQEHYQEALDHYQAAIQVGPRDRRGYLGLGSVYEAQGDLDKAVKIWRSGLLYAGPNDVELNTRIADALILLERLEEAGKAVKRLGRVARSLTPNVSRAYRTQVRGVVAMLRAKLALASGDMLTGLEELKTAVSSQQVGFESEEELEEQHQARMRLAAAYGFLGQWDLAAAEFDQAVKLLPQEVESRRALASAWRSAGRLKLAIRHYKQALEMDPDNKVIRLALAECEFQQQLNRGEEQRDWEPFRAMLSQAKEALPEAVSIQLLEAVFAETQGNLLQMVDLLEQAVEADPSSWRLIQALMLAHQKRGNQAAADAVLADYEKLQQEPAWLLRAEIFAERKQFNEAKQALDEGIKSLSGNKRIAAIRRLVQIGLQSGEFNQLRDRLSQEVGQSERPDLQLVEQVAEMALEARDFDQLTRWEEQLIELEGERGSLWRYYRAERLLFEVKANEDFHMLEAVRLQTKNEDSHMVEAVQLQTELEGLRPSWAPTYLLKGHIAQRQGRMDQAAEAYQRAIELGEDRVSVFEQLVGVLYRQNRFVDADRFLKRLSRHVAGSQSLSAIALSVSADQGQVDRTVDLALEGVSKRPEDAMALVWLGIALGLADRIDEAELTFYRAAKLAPKDARTWTALAAFYMQHNRSDSAREAIEKLAQNTNLTASKRAFVLAQGYELIGNRDRAEVLYREAATQAPRDVSIQQRVAAFFLPTDSAEAENCLRRILEVSPHNDSVRCKLAMVLAARGGEKNSQEAWELLGGAASDPNAPPVARRLQAMLLLRRPDSASRRQAQAILESLIGEADSLFSDDRLILAKLYEDRGRPRAAREQLATLASRRKAKPSHLAAYVDYLLRNDHTADAAHWLKQLEQIEPDSYRTVLLRARLLSRQNRVDELESMVEAFAERQLPTLDDDQRAKMLRRIADLYAEIGLHAVAERRYRELAEATPEGYKPLALWLAKVDRRDEAIQFCLAATGGKSPEAAVALCAVLFEAPPSEYDAVAIDEVLEQSLLDHPHDNRLSFYVATLRHMQGRREQAEQLYRQVLGSDPKHVLAMNNLATLLADDPHHREEAEELIDLAIEVSGATAQLLDTRAVVWLHQGKLPEAVELLSDLVVGPNVDPRYHFHLALAYYRSGKTDEARASFERTRSSGLHVRSLTPTQRALWLELLESLEGKRADNLHKVSKVTT